MWVLNKIFNISKQVYNQTQIYCITVIKYGSNLSILFPIWWENFNNEFNSLLFFKVNEGKNTKC